MGYYMCAEVRGQPMQVNSLLQPCGGPGIKLSHVSGRHLYLRASHLPGLAQPFSLLIILLENKIYFNFNEVQFFFFCVAHVLMYFICLVLICYITLCVCVVCSLVCRGTPVEGRE